MRVVLLGAGLQAQAACYDLVQQKDLTGVTVADQERSRAEELAARWNDPRVKPVGLDVGDADSVRRVLSGSRAVLSAVPYRFNAKLAELAVEAGASFCDLGGNNDVVNRELALDAEAKQAGVTIVPDCGLAPGMVAVLAEHAVRWFEAAVPGGASGASGGSVDSLEIRVGGLPQERGGILDYSLLFNIQGLINEYVEDAVVLEEGEPKRVRSLDDFETLTFPEPFGMLEAFTTSGGTSTLPETYRGRVRRLDYKTIRYPGHGRVFRAMMDLGLLAWDPVEVDGVRVAPRALFAKIAEPVLDRGLPDVTLMRLTASGTRGGKPARRVYEMIEYPDTQRGLTAMMRTTAFPATIVLLMLARGQVTAKGALPQERCIDPDRFLGELAARGLDVRIQDS